MLYKLTGIFVLFIAVCSVLFTSCATKRATLPVERAEFYRVEAERIFKEAAELDALVYETATPEQREAKARLTGEVIAFWKVLLRDITVEDARLTQLLRTITLALGLL